MRYGFFRAVGTPLIRGRLFTPRDDANAPQVVVINQSIAQRYWPGEDAAGKRITFANKPEAKDWITVVGVVADVKDHPGAEQARTGLLVAPRAAAVPDHDPGRAHRWSTGCHHRGNTAGVAAPGRLCAFGEGADYGEHHR